MCNNNNILLCFGASPADNPLISNKNNLSPYEIGLALKGLIYIFVNSRRKVFLVHIVPQPIQQTFTFTKSRRAKFMLKVSNKDFTTTSMTFWNLYCYLWTHFILFSSVAIVNFEQVYLEWTTVFLSTLIHFIE